MKIYKKINVFFLGLIIITLHCNANNKIIYLISPPRSLSVAFLRMMEARGDFAIFHEPSHAAFVAKKYPEIEQHYLEAAPKTHADMKRWIFKAAEQSNVFIKSMSFAEVEFLPYDQELLSHKDIHFVFLARNPHHSMISFYLKDIEAFGIPFIDGVIDSGKYSYVFGYQPLYEIIEIVKKYAVNPIHIIKTEDLYTKPEQTVRTFCEAVDIPFLPHSLRWKNLGKDFNPQISWHEGKEKEMAHLWHGDAIYSTSFHIPTQYKVDQQGNPTFEEITNIKHRKYCIKAYEENLIYYKKILNEV